MSSSLALVPFSVRARKAGLVRDPSVREFSMAPRWVPVGETEADKTWRARAAYRTRVNHTVCVLSAFARLCKKRCVRNALLAKLAVIQASCTENLCRWRTGWFNWYDRMEADAAREERAEIRRQLAMSEKDMYAYRRDLIRVTQELYPFCKLWQKIDVLRRGVRPAVVLVPVVQTKKIVKGRFGALVDSDDE
jgi:hypothetical protein